MVPVGGVALVAHRSSCGVGHRLLWLLVRLLVRARARARVGGLGRCLGSAQGAQGAAACEAAGCNCVEPEAQTQVHAEWPGWVAWGGGEGEMA